MKPRQNDFTFENEGFALVQEAAPDWDRIKAEKERQEADRRAAQKHQLELTTD